MVVMADVTEEERSAELYVSVHGGLDHTFLKRAVETQLRRLNDKESEEKKRFITHCDSAFQNHSRTSPNHPRSHQKFPKSCTWDIFSLLGLVKQIFFTVLLPSKINITEINHLPGVDAS